MPDHLPWNHRSTLIARLDEAKELVSLLVESAPIVLFRWDLQTNAMNWSGDEETVESAGIGRIHNGQDWLDRVHPDDEGGVRKALSRHLRGRSERFEASHRLCQADGSWRWVDVRGSVHRDEQGRPTHLLGALFDDHARRSAEDQAMWSATHDGLTGLPNRLALVEHLTTVLQSTTANAGLVLIDIARFRTVNRALGPKVGDGLLCQAAERIRSAGGESAFAARVNGDLFALVVPAEGDTTPPLAELSQQLIDVLKVPLTAEGHNIVLGACVGTLWMDGRWTDASAAMRDAERALARAKATGTSGWAAFTDSDTGHAERLTMEARLRDALRHDRLSLVYQPIVQLPDRSIVSFEALIRWTDPVLGFISPAEFIPLAEETGLIIPVGAWVLEQACATLHQWRGQPEGAHLRMNINLSPLQFGELGLVDRIDEILNRFPRARGFVNIEITETALLAHPERQALMLERLRALGCQIHIDDFGTGYSSLSNLAHLPVDALKVDREFVMRAEEDPRSLAIVRMVARMAQEMGLSLTAEGIETEGQVQLLSALGPCRGQGYLFARPLSEEAALEYLSAPTTVVREWLQAG
ncbi:MAG: putative bifunctional diguanylate cyclase/phosphodiesterase [Myxococcota bacterium]